MNTINLKMYYNNLGTGVQKFRDSGNNYYQRNVKQADNKLYKLSHTGYEILLDSIKRIFKLPDGTIITQ